MMLLRLSVVLLMSGGKISTQGKLSKNSFFQQAVKHENLWFLGLCFEHKSLVKSKFRNSCYSINFLRRLWRPKSSFTQIQGVLEAGVNRGIYVKAA